MEKHSPSNTVALLATLHTPTRGFEEQLEIRLDLSKDRLVVGRVKNGVPLSTMPGVLKILDGPRDRPPAKTA